MTSLKPRTWKTKPVLKVYS